MRLLQQVPITTFRAYNSSQSYLSDAEPRQIIAEDPHWDDVLVPPLSELCVHILVKHFQDKPVVDELKEKDRMLLLELLPLDLPLMLIIRLIPDDFFWKRACQNRWKVCDIASHGGIWKRLYLECHLQELIENFIPCYSDPQEILNILPLCMPHVHKLDIQQLLPPAVAETDPLAREQDTEDNETPPLGHYDLTAIFLTLTNLKELHVTYSVKNCGTEFAWHLFQFSKQECLHLAKGLQMSKQLTHLRLHRSLVDDEKMIMLVNHLLDHPSLSHLDLSHNKIKSCGAKAIAKLISESDVLVKLHLTNNEIDSEGCSALAFALSTKSALKELDVRLNKIDDAGGKDLANALVRNSALERLNLASNLLGEPTAIILSKMLVHNLSLQNIDLSCNNVGQVGGQKLQEGVKENKTLTTLDLRLTHCGQDAEFAINEVLKQNRERALKNK